MIGVRLAQKRGGGGLERWRDAVSMSYIFELGQRSESGWTLEWRVDLLEMRTNPPPPHSIFVPGMGVLTF